MKASLPDCCGSARGGLGLELPRLEATQALPSRWFLSLASQARPPQLGSLSPGFLQQRALEAPQLSGILPSTAFPTHATKLLAPGHLCPPPHPEQGLGEGGPRHTSPAPPEASRPPCSTINQDPHSHPCGPPHSEESHSKPLLETRPQEGRGKQRSEAWVVCLSGSISPGPPSGTGSAGALRSWASVPLGLSSVGGGLREEGPSDPPPHTRDWLF